MGASDPCEQLGFHRTGLVGADCQNVSMGGHKPLRKIRDPVVAAAPAGVRIRTRIHISVDEAEALSVIGLFLGGLFRAELASRIRCGALDRKRRAARRLRRKQAITAVSSSRSVTAPAASLDELRGSRVLGIDLNADHLAVCVLDKSGNPVGDPSTIQIATAGLAASRRDARIRSAITTLLNLAEQERCAAVVIENLDFADARATGREVLGRGGRGKRFRRAVAGIPTAKFRTRLTGMAARRGISVIGVDAAYTSQWGDQHWKSPLQQQTSVPVTRHHAAATAIGRRGLGLRIRRHPAGPRSGQRTAAGTPPGRARPHPNHVGRHGSSGPPTRTRCAPVHRITPARRGQHRSDRTRAGLTRLSTGTVFGSWTSCSG